MDEQRDDTSVARVDGVTPPPDMMARLMARQQARQWRQLRSMVQQMHNRTTRHACDEWRRRRLVRRGG